MTKVAYAWKDEAGKFRLSLLAKTANWGGKVARPAATFDDVKPLLQEASRRGLQVEWEN